MPESFRNQITSNSLLLELPRLCLYLLVYMIIETSSDTVPVWQPGCRLLAIVGSGRVVHKPRGISSKSRREFRVCRGRQRRKKLWGEGGILHGGVARCWKFCGINFAPSAKLSARKFRHCPAACKFSHYVGADDLRRRIPTNFRSRQRICGRWRVFKCPSSTDRIDQCFIAWITKVSSYVTNI